MTRNTYNAYCRCLDRTVGGQWGVYAFTFRGISGKRYFAGRSLAHAEAKADRFAARARVR